MRYLTKSRFKLGLECPTKLFYTKKKEYADSRIDDPFLLALAKGGFQVGELAKCYYPDGHDITELDYEISKKKTDELMKLENVVIFEAAIKYKNLFIRIDVLEKKGNVLNLIEVKSKSANPSEFDDEIWNQRELKKGVHSLKSTWKPYIYDTAFQSYVLQKAFPEFEVHNYLMCADKTKSATVDGLNQKFMLVEDKHGQTTAEVQGDISKEALGEEVLCLLPLDEVVEIIHNNEEMSERFDGKGFEDGLWHFAKMYENDERIDPVVGSKCKSCEFRTLEEGKKCGFNECWNLVHGMTDEELSQPFVFDVWNFRGAEKAIEAGKHLLTELDEEDIKAKPRKEGDGLSSSERQWLQVEKTKEGDGNPFFDLAGLAEEMNSWVYPLNMIDFETCMVAIPFTKGRHPYEQIAFQFSHHIIHEDGIIEHANEFLLSTPGQFPNFEFVRALKSALESNQGSIFRYSHHENTVLCQIMEQLQDSDEKDIEELTNFIKTITAKKDTKKSLWEGDRNMIDLCEMVKKYYFSPLTNGSNSIKYVLPAILNESKFLKEKYSQPIYGQEIKSFGFKEHQWIKLDDKDKVINPYDTLPPIFDKYDYESLELVMSDGDIANGGAALTAYAMMQFTHMTDQERKKVEAGLLRYCELDTFAMVMIWEHWNNLIKEKYELEEVA